MEPEKLLLQLDRELVASRKRTLRYDMYYEGEQPLKYMAPALEAEIGDRITQLVLNWPRLGADAYEECLDVEGFRHRDKAVEDLLWELWQENDGNEQSHDGILESLICGRAYVIVGAGDSDDDAPLMTVEHPLQMIARTDPRTRKVKDALKRWKDEDSVQWATLYVPDATIHFRKEQRAWVEDERDDHELGEPPVVQLVNRGRMLRQLGVSEFHDVMPVADAANKMATDMMVSGDFHAMPRRWAVGMTEDDFTDENGNPISTWSAIAGRIWTSDKDPDKVKYGQFDESDLQVFHDTIKVLAQLASQMMFLPQDYMSFTSDNPTSADAMRSAEARKVKRAERKQDVLGGGRGFARVAALLYRFSTGAWPDHDRSIETEWRDPATPTFAQKSDSVVKLTRAGIIPLEWARQELGYTLEERKAMADMDKRQAQLDPLATLADQFREEPPPEQLPDQPQLEPVA